MTKRDLNINAAAAPRGAPTDPVVIQRNLQTAANEAKMAGDYAEGDRIEQTLRSMSSHLSRPKRRDPILRLADTAPRLRVVETLREEAECILGSTITPQAVHFATEEVASSVPEPGGDRLGILGMLKQPASRVGDAAARIGLSERASGVPAQHTFPPKAIKRVSSMPRQVIAEMVWKAKKVEISAWSVAREQIGTAELLEGFEGMILDRWSVRTVCEICSVPVNGRNVKAMSTTIRLTLDAIGHAVVKNRFPGD